MTAAAGREVGSDASVLRRLAVEGALLAGPRPPATAEGVMAVASRLGGLQLDPTRAIERTEYLVLWSRLGRYDTALVSRLLAERKLFEHAAFYIPIDRLSEIRFQQKLFAAGESSWPRGARLWIEANARMHRGIIDHVRANGPSPSRAFDASKVDQPWQSTGWTNDRNVTRMVEFMDARGELAVSRREGSDRLWDLPERVLPSTPELTPNEYLRRRSLRLMRRLGFGTMMDVRDRSPTVADLDKAALTKVLHELADEGRLVPLDAKTWRHAEADPDAAPTLTTLLSPFEPLIKDRARTERLWDFRYKLEMYVPKDKREFGFYVLPVLHGDRLVGRLDAEMDRKAKVLRVNRLFWESRSTAAEAAAVNGAIAELGTWLGAEGVSRP